MRSGRVIILVVLLLFILGVGGAAAAYFFGLIPGMTPPGAGSEETAEVVVFTPTPPPIMEIIGAAQGLNRGDVIPTEALIALPFPTELVPPSAITDTSKIVGTRARYTIARGEPILSTLIVQSLAQLSPYGSDAAAQIPPGYVAISVPYDRRNGVAFGIQSGDHVNIIVSWALVDIDQNFQTILPNLTTMLIPPLSFSQYTGVEGSVSGMIVQDVSIPIPYPAFPTPLPFGRGERGVNVNKDFYVIPQEPQRPRLVSQSIIQDVLVLNVGNFVAAVTAPPPTATTDPAADAAASGGQAQEAPPAASPTPLPPDLITLIVTPQDALALNYINRMLELYPGAVQLTLLLRSAGDTSRVDTESVTMQYMFEKYNIAVPAKLNFGLYGSVPTVMPTPTQVVNPTPLP